MSCLKIVILFVLLSNVYANSDQSIQECVEDRLNSITWGVLSEYKTAVESKIRKADLMELGGVGAILCEEVLKDLELAYAGIAESKTSKEFDANKRLAEEIVKSKIGEWTLKFYLALHPVTEAPQIIEAIESLITEVITVKQKYIEQIEGQIPCCFEAAGCETGKMIFLHNGF